MIGILIIQVELSSLDLRDLTWSIVDNAKEQNLIDDTFLTEVGYEEGKDIEKPKEKYKKYLDNYSNLIDDKQE